MMRTKCNTKSQWLQATGFQVPLENARATACIHRPLANGSDSTNSRMIPAQLANNP
jgi:hypothetical protein